MGVVYGSGNSKTDNWVDNPANFDSNFDESALIL